ncbi:Abi family protein, partial [Streptococcus suis]
MKPFKTLDEQLAILEARGLVFSDKENAKKKLSFYGYYEIINGYKDFLLEKKQKITDHQEEC